MNELFGLPTSTLAIVLGALLCVAVATVVVLGVGNRTMFKFGLRNIPRRGLQSLLVVVGLSLGTLITTSAFVTGDTIDHSLTKDVYALFGRSDLDITWNGERDFGLDQGAVNEGHVIYASESGVDALETQFANDGDIDAFLPFLTVAAPVTNTRTGDAKPSIQLNGVDFDRLQRAGGLMLTSGRPADPKDLGPDGVFLSKRAAADLHARLGDSLVITISGKQTRVSVAGIVKDELASGVQGMSYSSVPGGLVLPLDRLRGIGGFEGDEISSLTVALHGTTRSTLDLAGPVAERIEEYLRDDGSQVFGPTVDGTNVEALRVDDAKNHRVEEAELAGNLFTTFFLVLGLFRWPPA